MKTQSTVIGTVTVRELHRHLESVDVLRRALNTSCPEDFTWAFLMDREDFVATWTGSDETNRHYTQEIRAKTSAELLLLWSQIDWNTERAASWRSIAIA